MGLVLDARRVRRGAAVGGRVARRVARRVGVVGPAEWTTRGGGRTENAIGGWKRGLRLDGRVTSWTFNNVDGEI